MAAVKARHTTVETEATPERPVGRSRRGSRSLVSRIGSIPRSIQRGVFSIPEGFRGLIRQAPGLALPQALVLGFVLGFVLQRRVFTRQWEK